MTSDGSDFRSPLRARPPELDRVLQVAFAGSNDAQRDPCFGERMGARSVPSKSVLAWITVVGQGLGDLVLCRACR